MKRLFLASVFAESADKFVDAFHDSLEKTTVAFIPTAADPYEDKWFVDVDRKALEERGYLVQEVDLKKKGEGNLREEMGNAGIIFVCGGNTFYLLEKARESGFDEVVKEFVEKGVIYIGSSAGSVLVGPDIEPVAWMDDPSKAKLDSTKGFGLVDFVALPHFGNKKYISKYEEIMEKYSGKYDLIKLTDQEAVVVEGGNHRIV
ncbi:MAG: Type 1 glutamine amidotransferase-like domain-containing protein [bacterium]|nr:Type 1 glutamine amidotransferase-like domain-containing protein [bacterium]